MVTQPGPENGDSFRGSSTLHTSQPLPLKPWAVHKMRRRGSLMTPNSRRWRVAAKRAATSEQTSFCAPTG